MSKGRADPQQAAIWQSLACWNQVAQAGFVWSCGSPCRNTACPLSRAQRHSCELNESVCLKGKVQLAVRSTLPVTQTCRRTCTSFDIGYVQGLQRRLCVESTAALDQPLLLTPEAKLDGWLLSPRFYCSPSYFSDRSIQVVRLSLSTKLRYLSKMIKHCQETLEWGFKKHWTADRSSISAPISLARTFLTIRVQQMGNITSF